MTSKAERKKFDFGRYKQRHIALKIVYFGWDYSGLAAQGDDNESTIEYHILKALIKTCLIESREKCNFNRCGRTDKGVSSYGQVLSLHVRSNLVDESANLGLFSHDLYSPTNPKICDDKFKKNPTTELNYVDMLNHNLPDHIKVIAWAPVKQHFSARFKCQSRSYSYIFPKGDLCIQSMQEALQHLIGEHDFRNLCSFDLKNGVTNHVRTILSASIKPIQTINNQDTKEQYNFYDMIIVGQAFLYHQIRCIMTIIFLVGSKKELPTITRDLLDLKKCPAKPHYVPASPLPLCLFDCRYSEDDLPQGWNHDLNALSNLIKQMKQLWWQYKTKSLMIERALFDLESIFTNNNTETDKVKRAELAGGWRDFGLQSDNMSDSKYVQLMKRSRDQSLESKLVELERKKLKKNQDGLDKIESQSD